MIPGSGLESVVSPRTRGAFYIFFSITLASLFPFVAHGLSQISINMSSIATIPDVFCSEIEIEHITELRSIC